MPTKDDCKVFYIVAKELDGAKTVHAFKDVIGTHCSYKYVNLEGKVVDLSKYADRTHHLDSDPLGNIIHETDALTEDQLKGTSDVLACDTYFRSDPPEQPGDINKKYGTLKNGAGCATVTSECEKHFYPLGLAPHGVNEYMFCKPVNNVCTGDGTTGQMCLLGDLPVGSSCWYENKDRSDICYWIKGRNHGTCMDNLCRTGNAGSRCDTDENCSTDYTCLDGFYCH